MKIALQINERKKLMLSKQKILTLLILVLLIAPSVFRLVPAGFYTMYDDMQVIRLEQMDKCVRDFQIPCRWVPDLGLGYGYPLFSYYAPLPYYLMELVHLLGISFITSVKLGFFASLVLSGLFFYLLSRRFFSRTTSLFTTFLYIYAPFRASGVYVRGAMGETWGMVVIPLVLLGFEKLISKKDLKSSIFFSLTLFVLLITHNLTVLVFSPLLILWMLLRLYKFRQKKLIRYFIQSLGLGIGMSAFFILPLIFERNLVHIETLTSGYFGFLQHFLNLSQIFISGRWGYGPSIFGPGDDAFLGLGPIHSILAFIGLTMAVINMEKFKRLKYFTALLGFVFILSAFMSHPRSTFIWELLNLEILQFPWRFIAVMVFTASLLSGFVLDFLPKRTKSVTGMLIVLIVMLSYGSFFKPKDWFYITDSEKLSGDNLKRQLTASIYDYLPIVAKKAPDEVALISPQVVEGTLEIKEAVKGSNWFDYNLNVLSESATVVIPVYNFPKWAVKVNDENVAVNNYGDLGLVSFRIPKGDILIKAKLKRTWPRIVGDYVTFLSIGILFYLVVNEKVIKISKKI